MNGNEHLRQTLEYYRQQRQKKLDELRPINSMIRNLEIELGEASSGPGEVEGNLANLPILEPQDIGFPQRTGQSQIRPDEFFGMSQSEAAKKYLTKIGHAVSLDELLDALNKGGAQVGGAEPKRTLQVSLSRNPLKEFVTPSANHIGLRSFYPSLPKATRPAWGQKNATKPTKRGKGAKRTAKAKNKPKATTSAGEKTKKAIETPMKSVLREVLNDGNPRTRDEILKAVEAKLGHPVTPISIFGALAHAKGFVTDENGRISLVQ